MSGRNFAMAVASFFSALALLAPAASAQVAAEHVKDLSLLVTPDLPCVWPVGQMPHAVVTQRRIGPFAFRRDLIMIDEHTGTQWDAPAHFVPPPDSGLPGAGPNGLLTGDKVPAWQFVGEACVIDIRQHVDSALAGSSFLIQPNIVKAWEQAHRELKFGDVVLFRSGYSDKYYKPFPAGDRFVSSPLRKDTPGWPAPTPDTMAYLAEKGVMALGLDGASMGPLPDLAAATHQAGGQRGMIWTECATNLGSLPETGALYAILAPKHAGGSGSECRALAITEPKLAARLIQGARRKQVADLSVTLSEDLPVTWPGYAAGEEATRYVGKVLNAFNQARGPYFSMTHVLDAHVGTHVVPPSFALPEEGFDEASYTAELRQALKQFETKYGPLGTTDLTVDRLPLPDMMGEAHVIDVRKLVGTTKESAWPASPQITLDLVKQHEKSRAIKAGEVVIFFSGYSDAHLKPLPAAPEQDRMLAAPLAGKAEGWPAPTPEVIAYLAEKGVRCVGTDGPTLGGVDKQQAMNVYWLAATKGLLPVEYLTNVGEIQEKNAFFLFAPVKIKGAAGGYGRALAIY